MQPRQITDEGPKSGAKHSVRSADCDPTTGWPFDRSARFAAEANESASASARGSECSHTLFSFATTDRPSLCSPVFVSLPPSFPPSLPEAVSRLSLFSSLLLHPSLHSSSLCFTPITHFHHCVPLHSLPSPSFRQSYQPLHSILSL